MAVLGIKCAAVEIVPKVLAKRTSHYINRFKKGREDIIDDARPGRLSPSTINENIKAVEKVILDNRRITIRKIADDGNILFGSCQAIFTAVLGTKFTAVEIVLKL